MGTRNMAMFEYGKHIALVVTIIALLFLIISCTPGAHVPLWTKTASVGNIEVVSHYCIRDVVQTSGSNEQVVDYWDTECAEADKDDCEHTKALLQGGFALNFLGWLLNFFLIFSLVVAIVPSLAAKMPSKLGSQMLTTAVAALMTFFYFLGTICACEGWPSHPAFEELEAGAATVLMCLGFLMSVAVIALCWVGIDGEAAASGDAAVTEPGAA